MKAKLFMLVCLTLSLVSCHYPDPGTGDCSEQIYRVWSNRFLNSAYKLLCLVDIEKALVDGDTIRANELMLDHQVMVSNYRDPLVVGQTWKLVTKFAGTIDLTKTDVSSWQLVGDSLQTSPSPNYFDILVRYDSATKRYYLSGKGSMWVDSRKTYYNSYEELKLIDYQSGVAIDYDIVEAYVSAQYRKLAVGELTLTAVNGFTGEKKTIKYTN